jgi:CRISPR-associated protein Csc1
MEIIAVKGTCLSPLQYHTVQAARGTKTGPFIGDLALTYSLLQSTGTIDESRMHRKKADYSELRGAPFLSTVLYPSEEEYFQYLPPLSRNTLLAIDTLGTNEEPTAPVPSGSSMYSNFYFTQAIAQGSVFHGFLLKENAIQIPPSVRIGNQRQCLLKLEEIPKGELEYGWSNLYTLQYVVGLERVVLEEGMERYDALHQYRIVKNVPRKKLIEWYAPLLER